ncbi:MAG: hypothetical protein OXC19_15045, partial [Bryobacterales bacterium]|nr:hypothetical protein [Bryobacterales bacterium]
MIVDLDRLVRRLDQKGQWSDPAPLSTYRYAQAYVLLGDPGAGKSTALEREHLETPDAELVTARDFRTIYGTPLSSSVQTVFIDGLDEARAGVGDPLGPFDEIRARLRGLAPRRVRISCRELDWHGENDRSNLSKVVPREELFVLRLEPLSRDEQRRIVEAQSEIPHAEAFLAKAAERGVGGLLANPQTLVLLVQAVGDNGEFPRGRTQTFEQACVVLAREPNEDHRIAAPLPSADRLLDAAGRMCAVSLLSGSAGLALPTAPVADDFVPISALGDTTGDEIHAARTRLFVGAGDRRCAPAHANIAAFLAARHLAALMDDSVPSGRILALLAGSDGIPPKHLRSLVAWLAVTSPALRRTLIERDPVAVLMYGDVREFEPSEKGLLLDEIERDPSRLHADIWSASALEAIASTDTASKLRSVLRNPDRSASKQGVVALVTTALATAPLAQQLSGLLIDVVRDDTRSPDVRRRALDTWIRGFADDPNRVDRYCELLVQLRELPSSDPHGELTATLLDALYPNGLSPSELWDFFPSDPALRQGLLAEFWQLLARNCPENHLRSHMNRLADLIPSIRPVLREQLLFDVPLRLLARTLEDCGDEIEPSRLFRWLSVGLDEAGHLNDAGNEAKELIARIRAWLEDHPDLQKDVIPIALPTDGFRPRGRMSTAIRELLYRSEPPDDIGRWHLDQAVLTISTDCRLMEFHIREFLENLAKQPVRVDAELARARRRLAASPQAIRHLESGLKSELPDDYLDDAEAYRRARAPDANLLRAVRRSRRQLRENRANPVLLHELARLYHAGAFIEGETTDRERLLKALDGDEELTEAAIMGIRGAPDREDLPSIDRVLRLRSRQELDWLTLPVLVGLTERSVSDVISFDNDRLATMLALRLARQDSSEDAAWYRECLRQRPSLVAEILLRFGRVALAAGEKHLPDLYRLSREPSYAEVAKRVTMPLLRAFPVRARADQHERLSDLLQSALMRCNGTKLRELIGHKAGLGSVTRTQRLYWLTAGLALEPKRFGSLLSEAGEPYVRCQILERMFPSPGTSIHEVPGLVDKLEPGATEFLIRQLGALRNPLRHEAGVSVGWGWTNSMGVEDHIVRLGRCSDKSATEALQRLADEPSLSGWKQHLEHALEAQRVIQRDAEYTPPTPAEVIAVLRDGPPASAADLRALALDRLGRIAKEVRSTNADLWQFFWNQDAHGKLKEPKPENPCRDALREILSQRLPDGCEVQREGQYAANRRADLRIVSGKRNIPVEIKKNSHRDVWRAIRNQLLPRYTNDPATGGLGIYLVLWFGPQHTAPVPEGPRPQTPDAMRDRLLANLTSEERRRAAVVVIDVT